MKQHRNRPRAAVISLAAADQSGGGDVLTVVERYWAGLKDHTTNRGDNLDPGGFVRALSDSFIAEPMASQDLRLRVAGQNIEALAGVALRGLPLSVLFQPEARTELGGMVARVRAGMPLRIALSAPRGAFRTELCAAMVLLPLAGDEGPASRVLGAIAFCEPPGRRFCRFRIVKPAETRRPDGRLALRIIEGGRSARV
ncbi:PAS domain-containing protein [Rhodovulum bhavnagarense]|uniref:PAS domain-containing protein n=1 Tax=Rhodovulum bhavnagarense TaxID=992286 RepID=A0A4R2RQE1_9RHOB|nr:PAS domain-containing protein [Rhodovulum bhavnagarense]TCP61405.1 PAS domain-containing protein [Rhodovulum bhavnagarense]